MMDAYNRKLRGQLEQEWDDVRKLKAAYAAPQGAEAVAWFYYEDGEFIRMYDSEEKARIAVEKFGGDYEPVFRRAASPAQTANVAQGAEKLCTICNGYGRYQDGNSGTEADGYAPNIVECECTDEERRHEYRDFAAPPAQTALTVPTHIINAIIDYGNARAGSRDAEANKDLSYAITAIRAALTAAPSGATKP